MGMSDANYQIHFANLGKLIKLYNLLETQRQALLTAVEGAIAQFDDSETEVETLAALLNTHKTIDSGFESYKTQVRNRAEDYIKDVLSVAIGYTGSSVTLADVLHDLAEDMGETPESVDGSAITATAPTYDAQNAGTGSLATPTSLSQLLTDEFWELECTSISGGAGAETWQVRGQPHLHAVLSAALTTGVAYNAVDANGEALFSVTLTAYTAGTGYKIAGDTDSEIGATAWSGAVKGTNTDSAGDVYLVLDLLSETEANDNNNQLSGWSNITGAALGVNCDTAGKIYATIVDDGGGSYHVDFYKATARAVGDLVGHTASYSGAGAQAIVADNSSGLGGTITIDAVTAADADIECILAFRRVRVYKEAGLSNVVAIGGLTADGTTTLVEQNSSGLTGTAVVAYTDGEASVQVRVGFAFAVGDKIYFTTTNDEAGTFAEFFRKLGIALPVDLTGSETIADTLAE